MCRAFLNVGTDSCCEVGPFMQVTTQQFILELRRDRVALDSRRSPTRAQVHNIPMEAVSKVEHERSLSAGCRTKVNDARFPLL